MTLVLRLPNRAEKDPQQQAQQVPGAEHDAGRADDRKRRPEAEHPQEDEGLADETVQSR